MRHTFEQTVFLFQFVSLQVDMRCDWYDSCRSVLVTRQVTTVWVNCFVTVRCRWNDVSPFDELTRWNLAPVITLSLFIFGMMTFWTAATFFIYFLFRPVLFRYVRVIAYVFCHAGVLVCLFVVNVADFGMLSLTIGYRILNCIINLWSLIFGFYLLLRVPSSSFQCHFCCSYCVACAFLFGIRLCRWLFL